MAYYFFLLAKCAKLEISKFGGKITASQFGISSTLGVSCVMLRTGFGHSQSFCDKYLIKDTIIFKK